MNYHYHIDLFYLEKGKILIKYIYIDHISTSER
jgi:hypothetical protein